MKLATSHTPSMHAIPNNGLYNYYQTFFHEGLRGPNDRDPIKEKIGFNKYSYELNDQEKEFFEELYVQQGKLIDINEFVYLRKYFKDFAGLSKVGSYVKDLFNFLELPNNLGLVIAPIGYGKTVLLRYMWIYLVSKSKSLQKDVIPIYLTIDHNKSSFSMQKNAEDFRNIFLNEILKERLVDVVRPYTEFNNENFWSYLKSGSDCFNTLEQIELDLKEIYGNDSEETMKRIKMARMEARNSNEFYYVALKYIRSELNILPVLIIDNIDTLSIEINIILLDIALYLSKEFNLKTLISIRDTTFYKIKENHNGIVKAYPPLLIFLEKLDVKAYIKNRTSAIKNKIRKSLPQFEYLNYEGDIRVTFKDGAKVFDVMLDKLLTDESINIISYVSNFNLRSINSLLIKYLSTGYIDFHSLVKRIVQSDLLDEIDDKKSIPIWVLLSAVITDNHRTRFSNNGNEGVINIYCNGRNLANDFFTRIHILNFVKRHGDTTSKEIQDSYLQLFSNSNIERKKQAINYALLRLCSFDLLDSPDEYKINNLDEMDRVKTVSITETGRYYLKEFRNYFEYLVYMKDDTELSSNDYGIIDCIKVHDFPGRYAETLKFLRMLFDAEKEFVFSLPTSKRLFFFDNFTDSEENNPFIVTAPLRSLLDFGSMSQSHSLKLDECLESCSNLLSEVNKHAAKFNQSIKV